MLSLSAASVHRRWPMPATRSARSLATLHAHRYAQCVCLDCACAFWCAPVCGAVLIAAFHFSEQHASPLLPAADQVVHYYSIRVAMAVWAVVSGTVQCRFMVSVIL